MGTAESSRPLPLRFGSPLQFRDRWQGTLVGAEVAEDWEVLNLVIERGLWRWASRVKVAFTTSPRWSLISVTLDCTSRQAFAREIPPVAVRARQLSRDTPLSVPDGRLFGLLVEPGHRRATDVVVVRGGAKYRLPVAALAFDGKTLRLGSRGEELAPYLTDEELLNGVQRALAANPHITGDERGALDVLASSGAVTIKGNVRTKQMKDLVYAALAPFAPLAEVRLEVMDDIDLELAIGQALERSGAQHRAEVYARSLLGEVTLFGHAVSAVAIDEITRVVTQVPGVRSVTSRMLSGPSVTPAATA
jgi:osmotically-inducible protein OsmY